ncbi:hypothetical protein BESB_006110 [Besnoitia besnoiti]|uniref:Uncharacterized protein n=1 Tax=Besnoitia besnoiti TaxID=94643 RepID=A0A2A9MQF8_BESBE|nr:hypothetical protein BESB_006110 [Besnoitia besnoiti]PFH38270.1 hypothetical protein BESB_006110 [Besnoitia besnoiti]
MAGPASSSAGLARSEAAKERTTQLVNSNATVQFPAGNRRGHDGASKGGKHRATLRLHDEIPARDPAAATIQALVVEMRQVMQQVISRNRYLEEEIRRSRAVLTREQGQKELYARSYHECRAELEKERQRSEFHSREFRALCCQLNETVQGFAADHEEIAKICDPPFCTEGKGLRKLHGLAQLLRVKLARGVHAHLRSDQEGAERTMQAQGRRPSAMAQTVQAPQRIVPGPSSEPVVLQKMAEPNSVPAPTASLEGFSQPAAVSSSGGGALPDSGAVVPAKRVSISLNTQGALSPSRTSSSRSSVSSRRESARHAPPKSAPQFGAYPSAGGESESHPLAGRSHTQQAGLPASTVVSPQAPSGEEVNGDSAGPQNAELNHVEHEGDGDNNSLSDGSFDSDYTSYTNSSASPDSSPRIPRQEAPPPRVTRPKFVPALSTAQAGTGSWMSGDREPKEYPQGV